MTEFSEVLAIRCSAIPREEVVYRWIQHRSYSARMFDATWWRTTISIPSFSGIAATGISHQVGWRRRVVASAFFLLLIHRIAWNRISAKFAFGGFSEVPRPRLRVLHVFARMPDREAGPKLWRG
jgi:hypothetical protein